MCIAYCAIHLMICEKAFTNNKKESFIGQKKMILTIMSAVNYSYWWIVYDRICFQTIAENILLDYIYQKLEFYKEW